VATSARIQNSSDPRHFIYRCFYKYFVYSASEGELASAELNLADEAITALKGIGDSVREVTPPVQEYERQKPTGEGHDAHY
jgi:hypothetical protein